MGRMGRMTGGVSAGGRVAWFHCFSGIAGDMALGSLLDAGADVGEVTAMLETLPLDGWSLEAEPVLRAGVAATKAVVRAREGPVRTHAHVVALVEEGRLPARVRRRSLAVLDALAQAEGKLHRRPPAQVHLHEVGAVDAIVDVVGTCAALEVLGVDTVQCSPVAVGMGMVRSAHGFLPNPAPAVVELLAGFPTEGREVSVELTTPTGAALMAALASGFGAQPAMTVERSGFGAGTRDLDGMPNATQVLVGVVAPVGTGPAPEAPPAVRLPAGQPVALLEANLDDVTGEVLARSVAVMLASGAHDAWLTGALMKKGRPAHVLHVLVDPSGAAAMIERIRAETGTLGVRGQLMSRWPAARHGEMVEVGGQPVRIKVGRGRAKAEHDDALTAAAALGLPLREVIRCAEVAWAERSEGIGEGVELQDRKGQPPPVA